MASVEIRNVVKQFSGHQVLHGVNVDVADGEFVALVGPSGCGKSTLLRMIAGLEEISGGQVVIGGNVVNQVAPKDRDIAMVFQNYALYPHMTVRENMAFSLTLRNKPKAEIDERINSAAAILDMVRFLDRYPRQLSGGQRQRVAMGRAIVRDPKVFLFDEPLSNLDAKLRVQMRTEIKALHQRLRTTSVYVTHDQVEAMTMADRIVVMNAGRIEQIGTPLDLYDRPANLFVAGFIGSPAMNFIHGVLCIDAQGARVQVANGAMLPLAGRVAGTDGQKVIYGVRPEHLQIAIGDSEGVPCRVRVVEPTGASTYVYAELAGSEMCGVFMQRLAFEPGTLIRLQPQTELVHVFDAESGAALLIEGSGKACAHAACFPNAGLTNQIDMDSEFMKIDNLIDETFDVLVGGAGVSGIAAALAAARQGARVVLIEPRPFIGGNAATGLCIHTFLTKQGRQVVYGIAQEIVDRLVAVGGAVGHVPTNGGYVYAVTPVDADLFRTETTAMLVEAGVTILFNTTLIGAEAADGHVRRVTVCSKDRLGYLMAKAFVDTTGDADLCFRAGAECREGWTGSGAMQPVSMMLRAVSVDVRKACEALSEFPPVYAKKAGVDEPFPVYFHGTFRRWNEILREMGIYDHDDHQFWTNTVWPNQLNVNASRLAGINGNDPLDLARATTQLTQQVHGLSDFLRRYIPGFEHALFLPNAFVGIRETRNIKGVYEISEDDIQAGRRFDDTIGQACFPVDIHHPDGKSQKHIDIGGDGAYDLPYRALIPEGFANLLAAGRCLSATSYAHGATRNMAPCMTTGEAAGVAAALSAKTGESCAALPIDLLQSTLRQAGVYLGERVAS